jgi:hypothetical protein
MVASKIQDFLQSRQTSSQANKDEKIQVELDEYFGLKRKFSLLPLRAS